jgi:hypothetical protein
MGLMRDAPTHRQTLASAEAPDGTKRYSFFAEELAKERREWFKFTALVRLSDRLY